LVLAAVVGASAVLGVVLGVSRRVESNVTLLIVGLMFGYITSAVVQILMQLAVEHELQSYVAWTFGSFSSVTWNQMSVFAPTVICGLVVAWVMIKPLNALLLGNDYARSMGVNVRLARYGIIFGAALLAGAVTAYCGPVGFLGIAVPHLGRVLLRTTDHRRLVPAVMLLGAIVALLADLFSRCPALNWPFPSTRSRRSSAHPWWWR
jgi:iron complex transport system permease protein